MPDYTAKRADEYLSAMLSDFAADPNGGTLDSADSGNVLVILFNQLALRLNALDEGVQALHDQWDPDNAQGVQLDIIGALRGVPRNQPTYSTATVTITGTSGTVIPAGKLIEGGGTDGTARWALTEDVTIPGGGSTTTTVQAQEAGVVTAEVADLSTIVTPVDGWTSVTNAAAVSESTTAGVARELDSAYRLRQAQSLQITGSTNTAAIRAALRDLDFVTTAIVLENDTGSSTSIGGVTVSAHSIAVIIAPAFASLTTAQKTSIGSTIYQRLAAGISTTSAANSVTVTGEDGLDKTVSWADVASLSITVAVTVVLDTGYVLADVETAVQDAVAAFFAQVSVGEEITDMDLIAGKDGLEDTTAIGRITGVKRVSSVTLDDGGGASTTLTPDLNEQPTLSGSASVST